LDTVHRNHIEDGTAIVVHISGRVPLNTTAMIHRGSGIGPADGWIAGPAPFLEGFLAATARAFVMPARRTPLHLESTASAG
jgi:hypothetical protein